MLTGLFFVVVVVFNLLGVWLNLYPVDSSNKGLEFYS